MTTLRDTLVQLMTVIEAVQGIRKAPVDPPETMAVFPFAVGYVETGVWKIGPPEIMTGLHNVALEVHVSREQDLAHAVKDVMRFSDSVPNAILLAFKNGTLTTLQTFGDITYTFGPLGWGGIATVGFKFVITQVKTQSVIS